MCHQKTFSIYDFYNTQIITCLAELRITRPKVYRCDIIIGNHNCTHNCNHIHNRIFNHSCIHIRDKAFCYQHLYTVEMLIASKNDQVVLHKLWLGDFFTSWWIIPRFAALELYINIIVICNNIYISVVR